MVKTTPRHTSSNVSGVRSSGASPSHGKLEFFYRRGNEVRDIHLGLHRIAAIMQAFGNPQDGVPVLHIGGTNGKGSVAAMSESILRHAGWRTGLYTSPHLVRLQERIRVNGREISLPKISSLAERLDRKEADLLSQNLLDRPLTYFEMITACAFLHFADEKVDVAIVEVGLGGLLDATNIVRPQVCVITNIGYDHQDILGRSLTKIAIEKAGIIKPGKPIISGCQAPAARRIVRSQAMSLDAPIIEIDRDCKIRIKDGRKGRCRLHLRTKRGYYRDLRLALAGVHQARNAALAVTAIEHLELPVRISDVRRGLAGTVWPGRLDEYPARRKTLLEGAHNPEGAQTLRHFLLKRRKVEIHMVFGALRDKDFRKMGAALFPLARSIHLVAPANSRAVGADEIAEAHPRHRERMRLHENSHEALQAAWKECPRNGLVVVTGSLYLLGELLPVVQRDSRRRQRARLAVKAS